MEIILHRVNKINQLKKINPKYGVEIDIRAKGSKIILNHEPFLNGDLFTNYLSEFNHGTLVVNIKEAGIEQEVIKLLKKYNIENYFLLDVEMPFLYNSSKKKYQKIAIRFSEYENIINSKFFIGKLNWIWIDTVSKFPINKSNLKIIKNFKSCLVCPERWGRKLDIPRYFKQMSKLNYFPSAIMTSEECSEVWSKLLIK